MVKNNEIFLGSGASITKIPELDIYIPITETSGTLTTVTASSGFQTDFILVKNLYIGCLVHIYNGTTKKTTHRVTGNTGTTVSFSPSATIASGDYIVIDSYGAPCPAPKSSTTARLLADTWLGIAESITFPATEVEMKQMNLSLGGSRNFTYQYKGIETPTGGSLDLVSNHCDVPIIIAGGAGKFQDLHDALINGASAVACGSLFNFGDNNPLRAKAFLKNLGVPLKNI